MLWIAPTEHELQRILRNTTHGWISSPLPEQHGCDILAPTRNGVIGFQRKTLPDLTASLQDGRLYYELSQLVSSATVTHSFLIVESLFTRTTDNLHYTEAPISVSTLRALVAKFAAYGTSYVPTSSPPDTLAACLSISHYLSSDKALSIHRPKQTSNEWGLTTNKTYGVFLLQSFPGIGPKVATAIYEHFNGVPLAWTVTAADLARVPGVGKVRAATLLDALRPPTAPESPAKPAAGPQEPAVSQSP